MLFKLHLHVLHNSGTFPNLHMPVTEALPLHGLGMSLLQVATASSKVSANTYIMETTFVLLSAAILSFVAPIRTQFLNLSIKCIDPLIVNSEPLSYPPPSSTVRTVHCLDSLDRSIWIGSFGIIVINNTVLFCHIFDTMFYTFKCTNQRLRITSIGTPYTAAIRNSRHIHSHNCAYREAVIHLHCIPASSLRVHYKSIFPLSRYIPFSNLLSDC